MRAHAVLQGYSKRFESDKESNARTYPQRVGLPSQLLTKTIGQDGFQPPLENRE